MNLSLRIDNIRKVLKKHQLDSCLVSSLSNIIYLTGFSGFSAHEREAFLLISKNSQYIFTDGRYKEAVQKNISNFKLIEVSSRLPSKKAIAKVGKKEKIRSLGIEENNLSVSEYKNLEKNFEKLINFNIHTLRIKKDNDEILEIEKACKLTDKTFEYILTKIKLGISEKELAFEIEYFIKKNQADIAFSPIVAFGENSSIPHHSSGGKTLAPGNIILMDLGAKANNYCSDMTRTVFFGKASNEQKRMYNTVLEAQKLAIDFLTSRFYHIPSDRKLIEAKKVDKVARNYITSQEFSTIPHSLGHGVGIEIHEMPRLSEKSKDVLTPGMVFSIEPGIYIPNFGGVRIEDLVVLEKSGLKILTHSTKDIIEL